MSEFEKKLEKAAEAHADGCAERDDRDWRLIKEAYLAGHMEKRLIGEDSMSEALQTKLGRVRAKVKAGEKIYRACEGEGLSLAQWRHHQWILRTREETIREIIDFLESPEARYLNGKTTSDVATAIDHFFLTPKENG